MCKYTVDIFFMFLEIYQKCSFSLRASGEERSCVWLTDSWAGRETEFDMQRKQTCSVNCSLQAKWQNVFITGSEENWPHHSVSKMTDL